MSAGSMYVPSVLLSSYAHPISDVVHRYLPPGTAFWVHAYSMHHDARNFSNPATFWPERWLFAAAVAPSECQDAPTMATTATATAEAEKAGRTSEGPAPEGFLHNLDAFVPFSHGPMNCVGKRLAHAEIRSVVCAILQRFHVCAAEGRGGHREKGEEGESVLDLAAYARGFLDFFVTVRPPVRVSLEARL